MRRYSEAAKADVRRRIDFSRASLEITADQRWGMNPVLELNTKWKAGKGLSHRETILRATRKSISHFTDNFV